MKSGRVADRTGTFWVSDGAQSVEGRGEEDASESSSIAPCRARAALGEDHVTAVGADDEYTLVVQLFDSPQSAAQLMVTSRECAAEQERLKLEEGSRVTSEGVSARGADWMLTERAGGKSGPYRQVFVRWGNVVVTTLQEGTGAPLTFAEAVTRQVSNAAR